MAATAMVVVEVMGGKVVGTLVLVELAVAARAVVMLAGGGRGVAEMAAEARAEDHKVAAAAAMEMMEAVAMAADARTQLPRCSRCICWKQHRTRSVQAHRRRHHPAFVVRMHAHSSQHR